VAAAASLRFAFEELAPQFERGSGHKVTLVFGSTGNLTQQIEQGAPVDAFFAADEAAIEHLARRGRIVPDTRRRYAVGRVVVAVNERTAIQDPSLQDLTQPEIQRVAIANPVHAPYGQAARQVLERTGLWVQVQPKLVYGEDITQALQYVRTGNADAALLALSVAAVPEIRYSLVDERLHAPLGQAAAVVRGTTQEALARGFLDFVSGPEGQAILQRYGFAPPG
jgi:molybdate transport system substrate-binding protein